MSNGPVTVLTALRAEAWAVRGRVGGARLLRTGMGPGRVARFLAREPDPFGPGAAVVLGVAGGIAPGVRSGDVVVARSVRDARGTVAVADGTALVAALRAAGCTVRHVPALTSDHVLYRGGRELLDRGDAECVDMESAALARAALAAGRPPVTVVRVVADLVDSPLHRVTAAPAGARALLVLRRIAPVVVDRRTVDLQEVTR